jgi:SAM-dependent methyltransferase
MLARNIGNSIGYNESRQGLGGEHGELFPRVLSDPLEDAAAFLKPARECGVLHLGCGKGDQFYRYDWVFERPIGIDLSAARLKLARVQYPGAHLVQGDVHRLPVANAQFGGLFSFSVLQYVDRSVVLAECARILRPGGRAAFIENLAGHPLAKLYRGLRRILSWPYPPYETPRSYLSSEGLDVFRSVFSEVDVRFYEILSPVTYVAAALRAAMTRSTSHVPGSYQERLEPLKRALIQLDRCVLERVPAARRLAWYVAVHARR